MFLKTTIFWAALVMSLSTCHLIAQTSDSVESQITQLMDAQQKSWNRGDIEGFMEHYWHSDSLMFIGSKGITYGWKPTLENYKNSYPDQATMGQLTFTILKVEPLSDSSCFVLGKWHLKRETDEPQGMYTLLWKKMNGKWVIVIDHSS